MNSVVKTLQKILKKAVISPLLKQAVEDSLEAVQKKDYSLAYNLTACKSFICGGKSDLDRNAFHEDSEANEKALGRDVYSLLDGVHFELAMRPGGMPSGMMLVSAQGIQTMKVKGKHPVIIRMKIERDRIEKEAKKRVWGKSA